MVLVLEVARIGVVPIATRCISGRIERKDQRQTKLTELSNLALFLLPPSRMLSRLISALASCSLRALRELVTEHAPPSPLLYPLIASLLISSRVP